MEIDLSEIRFGSMVWIKTAQVWKEWWLLSKQC
jgi:hypothetical protein